VWIAISGRGDPLQHLNPLSWRTALGAWRTNGQHIGGLLDFALVLTHEAPAPDPEQRDA